MAKAKKKPAKKPAKAVKKSAKPAKKSAPKKSAPKKSAAKKPAPKKTAAKKPAVKKPAAAKAAPVKRAPAAPMHDAAGEAQFARAVGYQTGSASAPADDKAQVDTAWGNEHTHNDPEPTYTPDHSSDDHDDE